ncbi:Cystatin domain-containing protein [Cinnamomum micranthum f. kanehirae]|uniref:Cystatin domain-containing protein n=1 Tax=Cinnamomum micranthum f. kanehirae TaxID=337451 RepID=A0A3S3MAS2_9MAGN|nr:Cystatin domain-containing protein [Cinnamomum micranthum f. kanehirae]
MKIHSFISHPLLLLLLLALVHKLALASAREPMVVGAWEPIKDVKDPRVQGLGKFSVLEYNKEKNAYLSFKSVVDGQEQVVAGVNYLLTVEAMDGEVTKTYEALVWEKDWEGFKRLISFKLIKEREEKKGEQRGDDGGCPREKREHR